MKGKTLIVVAISMLLLSGCPGSDNSSKDNTDSNTHTPRQSKSPLILEATSLEYGAELNWNQENFPDATFNLCIVEDQPEADFEDCFVDAESTISYGHASPLTLTGYAGGRRYWMQLEAEMPSGDTIKSWPVMVTTRIDDTRLLETDEYDWRNDPGLEEEKQAIAQQMSGFQQSLESKDIPAAASLIAEDRRDVYEDLFGNNPDAMPAFGELLDFAEISFLSPPTDAEADFTVRTAEYEIEMNGFTFYMRWMKDGDTWLLMDF